MTMPDLLQTIVAATERITETRRAREPLTALAQRAAGASPRGDRFTDGLRARERINVIAECKRRSPSKGVLAPAYDPVAIARSYESGGAAAISVLTEPTFFDGALEHLASVRRSVSLPLLRKDFVVDEYQLFEARANGADAILLIVAVLDDDDLYELHREARSLDLDVIVEVHDEQELMRALDVDADILGINNRDLADFSVDIERTYELLSDVPAGKTVVSESGYSTREQLEDLDRVGVDAVLIGETLMRARDVEAACRQLAAGHERHFET